MNFCQYCGTKTEAPGAAFCPGCGRPLLPDATAGGASGTGREGATTPGGQNSNRSPESPDAQGGGTLRLDMPEKAPAQKAGNQTQAEGDAKGNGSMDSDQMQRAQINGAYGHGEAVGYPPNPAGVQDQQAAWGPPPYGGYPPTPYGAYGYQGGYAAPYGRPTAQPHPGAYEHAPGGGGTWEPTGHQGIPYAQPAAYGGHEAYNPQPPWGPYGTQGSAGAYGWDAAQEGMPKKKLSRREKRRLKKERGRQAEAAWVQEEPYYDGYYDDVLPEDAGEDAEGIDWGLVRRVLLLIALAVLIVAGCAALMYLL